MTVARPRAGIGSVLLFGALIAITAFVALAVRSPANERPRLGAVIAAAAGSAGDGGTLNLADVADFPWDRVHVFLGYSSKADIYESLGFAWAPVSPIQDLLLGDLSLASDELTLMVFVRGERDVTGWAILNREEFDKAAYVQFETGNDWAIVSSRDRALFIVKDISGTIADSGAAGWLLTQD